MSKMSSHDPFEHLTHKLWPKEGSEVKLSIWLLPTKNQEPPRFPYVQVACIKLLEIFQQGLQLCFKPHLNRRSAHKVMGPQSCISPNFGNFETKCQLGAGPVAKHRVYYKVVMTFVSPRSPVVRPNTKNASAMH